MSISFTWVPFYIELSDKILTFKDDRASLIAKVKEAHSLVNKELPKIENDNNNIFDIDPFTVFALFNRGKQSVEARKAICTGYKKVFGIEAEVPQDFEGVPMFNYNQYCFYRYVNDPKRDNSCFDMLWNLFDEAIKFSQGEDNATRFSEYFEKSLKLTLVGLSKLTIGLFQVRPNTFVNYDSVNRTLIECKLGRTLNIQSSEDYLSLCKDVSDYIQSSSECQTLPEFSSLAYDNKVNGKSIFSDDKNIQEEVKSMDISLNTILYGPPGTGKTYNTVNYAVSIIENKDLDSVKAEPYSNVVKRYNEYKADGLIEFTTFHQSYGYEEFIEGIKPVMESGNEEQKSIEYEITPGLFKSFCERAAQPVLKKSSMDIGLNASPTIWKVSLEGTGDNPTRTECLENNHIRIGYDGYGENVTSETDFSENGGKNVLNALIYKMKIGDIVLSCYSSTTIDAIGVVTGEYEWHDEYEYYKRLRNVNWLVKGIREDISEANGSTMTLSSVYRMNITLSDVMAIVSKYSEETDKVQGNDNNYVFIIDEINRGNISKIFGELITLIEPSKRIGQEEAANVRLPYSKKLFGVPDNVFLIGTMNTADRSIATIDTALRRRFRFKEMQPDHDVLDGVTVEGISIKDMLIRMNKRICVLFDREHTIGHAYFIPLKNNQNIKILAGIFENNIIPLLQEYFYDDYEKIRMVLGDNNAEKEEDQFIIARSINVPELFGKTEYDIDDCKSYEINSSAFAHIEAYKHI